MKKSLSVLLVLILLTGMIPFACASDIDSFDPVKQLNDQTIWTWIEINGSLYIDTDINYDLENGEDVQITGKETYYYDSENNVATMITETQTPEGYELKYFDNYPTARVFTYTASMGGADHTEAEDVDEAEVLSAWSDNVAHMDLSGGVLKYAEEIENYYVFEYDLDGRDVTLYFSTNTYWLQMVRESGFTDYGKPYDVLRQYSVAETEQPDTTIKDSLSWEALGSAAQLPPNATVHSQAYDDSYEPQESGGTAAAPDRLTFSATDIYGNHVDESIIEGSRLVILNFWEPHCGVCVKEMPDMEALYQKYRNAGVLFLGVYGRDEDVTDEEARETAEDTGVTYPIFRDCPGLKPYRNEGWPDNYFFDGEGRLLNEEAIGGYKTAEAWEELILRFLYS